MTIDSVQMEDMGSGEMKPVIYFRGKDKGLVLNKTNANTIAGMYGPDTQGWQGRGITLFPTQVDFQGRQVAAIRVRMQPPSNGGQQPAGDDWADNLPPATNQPAPDDMADEDVPF